MPEATIIKRKLSRTFIREWRTSKGMSLETLAGRVPMDKGNLSKVERGILPYNQEMLERIADALMTDPASLLMRDPSDGEAMWSLFDRAKPGQRRQIVEIGNALLRSGTEG
jgi:transcriptional regulator with XRE-family HTH domain